MDNSVMVEGFPWCKGQVVKIGLSGLTSKILCEKHNNDLSDIDTAGIRGFEALGEMRRLANVREKLKTGALESVSGQSRWVWLRTVVSQDIDQSLLRSQRCHRQGFNGCRAALRATGPNSLWS